MKQRRKFAFTVVGVWLALGVSAAAQQVGAPDDSSACAALDQLREGAPTSRDHQTLDDCISAMLSSLAEAALSPLTIERGVSDFAADFTAQYRHENNTRAFKDKFAERSSILLHAQLQKGRELRPEMARAVAGAVLVLNSVRSREALLEGLAYPDQVVRYLSAKGLAALRDEIGADARLTGLTLDAIGQAGRGEINGVVVAMIYRASAYKDHPAEAAGTILRTMDGRLDSMSRSGKDFGRVELVAIDILGLMADDNKLDSGLKAEVVRRLAPLLRMHTERYGDQDVPEHELEAIKDTIDGTEGLLKKIVSPSSGAPNISEKMQRGGDGVVDEMKLELLDWIGYAQGEGILNRAPWEVPRGAPWEVSRGAP